MLKAFSWPEFLLASIVLSLIWYAGVFLVYYRKTGTPIGDALPHGWEDEVDVMDVKEGLIGASSQQHGVSIVEADEFSFAEKEVPDQLDQIGMVADAQQEIKTICGILESEQGDKEDFYALFGVIRSKYPALAVSPQLGAFNNFIREHVPFHLTAEELENVWI